MTTFHSRLFSSLGALFFSLCLQSAQAADPTVAVKRVNITYSIAKDLRLCASPVCGGWYVTPVNILTMGLMSEAETQAALASVVPTATYVSDLTFGCTQWSDAEIAAFTQAAERGTALVSGQVIDQGEITVYGGKQPLKTFLVRDAYTAATKNAAFGTYLNVQNSGIVCVTTPCPYYSADVLNSNLLYDFHDLSFAKAGLTAEEEQAARAQLATGGLLITGLSQPYQGQAGTGTSISATQVFWPFPPKKN